MNLLQETCVSIIQTSVYKVLIWIISRFEKCARFRNDVTNQYKLIIHIL